MIKYLIFIFTIVSLTTGTCFAQNIANKQADYKTLNLNKTTENFIIRVQKDFKYVF